MLQCCEKVKEIKNMINKKSKIFLISLVIICLFATQAVIAADINTVQNLTVNGKDVSIVGEYNSDILSDSGNDFYSLYQEIIAANGTLNLEKDYTFDSSNDSLAGPIEISKTLTINGKGHYIDGALSSPFFKITGNNVILSDITFRNGSSFNSNSSIDVYGNNVKFDHCVFENNTGTNGGAIYWGGNNGEISYSAFYENIAREKGGAIYWNGQNGTIGNSNLNQNHANSEGGAVYWNGTDGTIVGSDLRYNSAGWGGAVCWNGRNGLINETNFEENMASWAGAVLWNAQNGTIINSTFKKNQAGYEGGAIQWNGADGVIVGSTLNNNNAYWGGAVRWNGPNGLINNSELNYNTGNYYGGAVYWAGQNGTIEGSTLNKNNAGTEGGAVHWVNSYGVINGSTLNNNNANYGGAVGWSASNGIIVNSTLNNNKASSTGGAVNWNGQSGTIKDSTLNENTANQGGAIQWNGDNCSISNTEFEENQAPAEGGAIYLNSENAVLSNVTMYRSHEARNGGAIYVTEKSKNATVSGNFSNNTAILNGGAIYWAAIDGKLDNSYFQDNHVYNSAFYDNPNQGTDVNGGAVYWKGDNALVNSSQFISNIAYYSGTEVCQGGAISFHDNNATVENCYFYDNIGDSEGGAIYWNGEDGIEVFNSKFNANGAYYSGGAVYGNGENILINQSVFNDNFVRFSSGGAIYLNGNDGIVSDSIFDANVADISGGAIYGIGKNILINQSLFTDNTALEYIGGAVALQASGTIDNSNFTNNYAYKGGAIHWIDQGISIVNNSKFYNNSAVYSGGAIACDYYYDTDEKFIQNSLFVNNSCVNYGGAIGSLNTEIDNCTFINNTANLGGAIHSYMSKINSSHFNDNNADLGKDLYHSGTELINTDIPDENMVFVPSDLVEIVDYTIGNSTRLMNNSYIGMCFERNSLMPLYGTYDESLDALVNALTGENIAEYLKLLIYDSFNSMDDVFAHEGDNFTLYPEGLEGNVSAMQDKSNWVSITRTDYYSRVVHIFSDCDYTITEHPVAKRILELYNNGTRVSQDETKVVNGSTILYHFSSLISPASQSLFLFLIEKPNMTVNKNYLNTSQVIYVDDVVAFNITLTNNGKGPLSNVSVEEIYNSKELQYLTHSDNSTWNKNGNIFVYKGNIPAGKNVTFTVWFKTLTNGTLINNVTAKAKGINATPANNSTIVYKRITINVNKVWNDTNNQDGVRPDGVTVVLVADGNVVGRATLNASNNWSVSFANLPVYSNGSVIKYSVGELDVANYTSVISNTTAYDWTVVNTHVPVVTDVSCC